MNRKKIRLGKSTPPITLLLITSIFFLLSGADLAMAQIYNIGETSLGSPAAPPPTCSAPDSGGDIATPPSGGIDFNGSGSGTGILVSGDASCQQRKTISDCEKQERGLISDRTDFYKKMSACLGIPDLNQILKETRDLARAGWKENNVSSPAQKQYGELATCVEAAFGSCPDCLTNNTLKSCSSCLQKLIGDKCFKLNTVSDWIPSFPLKCVEAGVSGLGAFFDEAMAEVDVHNFACHQAIDELRTQGGCTGGSSWNPWATPVEPPHDCMKACDLTTSCKNRTDFINKGNRKRCDACQKACRQDPDFCKKIANRWKT